MSAWPMARGKPAPRWSVVAADGLSPAFRAGLAACRAIVWVGPPLLASPAAANSGSVPAGRLFLPLTVAPVWLRTRLKWAATAPLTSGAEAAVLLAMSVLEIVAVPFAPVRSSPPPAPPEAVLVATVLL